MLELDESLHPLLTPQKCTTLKQFHIQRLTQLLGRNPEFIARILDISYTKAVALLEHLFREHSVFPVNGLESYQQQVRSELVFDSGNVQLNSLLNGGFKSGNVYEVFGPSGSGKTQLCLTLAIKGVLSGTDRTVMYLDTKNDLVPQRLLEILQSVTSETESVSALGRILVSKCFHVDAALQALRKLVASCKLAGSNRTKMLVVDSLAVLLLSVLPHGIKIASGLACELVHVLHEVAAQGVAVLCTNHARMLQGGEMKPALGNLLVRLADVRLQAEHLSESTEGSCRKFTVVKGKNSSGSCTVKLDKGGVC